MEFLKRTWAEVDLDDLTYNMKEIFKKINGKQMIMSVVKCDAYGHGDGFVSRKLQELGVDWFGVSSINEAISLRKEGIIKPILILGYTPKEACYLLKKYNIAQCVMSLEYGKILDDCCEEFQFVLDVHIKIDTGMGRLGFQGDNENLKQSINEIEEISNMKNINITGIFTHNAVADSYSNEEIEFTKEQLNTFKNIISKLKNKGINTGISHYANSASIINDEISQVEKEFKMCRAGIITYGMSPSKDCSSNENMISLKPIMTLKTTIGFIKKIKAGTKISYGLTYTAPEDLIVATVPIGYGDGYNRQLSNKSYMLVKGEIAPVVGRVCMDQVVIDITDIDKVSLGDEVVVFGNQKGVELPIEYIADLVDTINYEITCAITKRVPRVYIENNTVIGICDNIKFKYD